MYAQAELRSIADHARLTIALVLTLVLTRLPHMPRHLEWQRGWLSTKDQARCRAPCLHCRVCRPCKFPSRVDAAYNTMGGQHGMVGTARLSCTRGRASEEG